MMQSQAIKGGTQELLLESPDREFELVRLAVRGDRFAFKQLFESNVNRVYAVCLRFSSDADTADELTQEVFVKAWEKLGTFHYQSKFSTWLHSIAANCFLMMKRTEKRLTEKIGVLGNEMIRENTYRAPGFQFDTNIDLENAIGELPEKMKAAFILHDVEGYKHHEVAKMLGIETGTSKAHIHRARKILREKLR